MKLGCTASARRGACAVALLVLLAPLLHAQTGSIHGTVVLEDLPRGVAGVNIVIPGGTHGTITDTRGAFTIPDVPEGVYRVRASYIGYAPVLRDSVRVRAGERTELRIVLTSSPFLLDEVVVTGTLNQHLLKDSPVLTEVMSSRDLRMVGSSDLADIMRSHTGIEIGTGIGQTQSAQLHGLSDNHVLVLVDGERVTGKVDGAVDLGQIPVQAIEKIEVVKGPLSAKYGTDAIGGVINIITRKAGEGSRATVAAHVGGYERRDIEASASHSVTDAFGAGSMLGVFVNAAWNSFGGVDYNASDNFMEMPERDRKHVGVKTDMRISDALSFDLRGEYYRDRSEWLAGNPSVFFRDIAGNDKWTGTASARYAFSPLTSLSATAHVSTNDHSSIEESRSGNRLRDDASKERIETARLQFATAPYGNSIVTLGYEYTAERAESDRLDNRSKAYYNNVLYAEDEWSMGPVMLSVGGRFSHNSVYGNFFAPRVSGVWKVDEQLTLRASYGRGFRAPSINELYIDFPNNGVGYIVKGEPTLKAESSHGYNAGLQYARDNLVWLRVNAYRNDLTNLIDYYVRSGNPITLSYRNIATAVTMGVDVDIDMQLHSSLLLGAGYGYTVAEDGAGRDLPFRTPHSLTLRLRHDWAVTGLRTFVRARWFDRKLVTDEQINLSIYTGGGDAKFFHTPAYAVVDVRFSRVLFDRLEVSAGVHNATDQTFYPFGQIKGREWFAGATWTIE